MIKKILLGASALVMSVPVFSQHVLTNSNATPVLGEDFTISRFTWDGNSGTDGANQTWDFSGIIATGSVDFTHVETSTCPSSSSFSNATLSLNIDNGAQYEHYNISNSSMERTGTYAGGVPIVYTNDEKLLTFPFEYLDTYSDPFAAEFNSAGYDFVRSGDVTVTADSYGTLMLPNQTYNNVVRVKIEEDYQDDLNGSLYAAYLVTIYQYFEEGSHFPILSLTEYDFGSGTNYYGNFHEPSLSIEVPSKVENAFSVYPNPSAGLMNVILEGDYSNYSMQILSLEGKVVRGKAKFQHQIDVSNLEEGVYFIQLMNGSNITETKRFVKKN